MDSLRERRVRAHGDGHARRDHEQRTAVMRRLCLTLTGISVSLVCGCSSISNIATKDAVRRANLLATLEREPGQSGCQINESPVASTPDNPANDSAPRLQASLDRVRSEKIFGNFALSQPPSPHAEFDEAWRLVELAKSTKEGKLPAEADETERMLLERLPWAGDIGIPRDADAKVQNILMGVVANARLFIGQLANQQGDQPDPLNKLLPPGLGKATMPMSKDQPPAQAGETITVKTFAQSIDAHNRSPFEKLNDLASFRAFHLLALFSAAHVHAILTNPALDPDHNPGKLDAEVRIFNVARYLSAYFDAYFRGGQFVQLTVDDDALSTALTNKLAGPLKQTGVSAAQIKSALKGQVDRVCSGDTNGASVCSGLKLGSTAFVTRAGLSVQFSGVSFSVGNGVSHTYPQVAQFGSQMIRVFVEALFDANGAHPLGMPNSTACQEQLFGKDECLAATQKPDTRLTQIDMLASASEALSQTATGALIRGASAASLNNETVAQMLETLAGVNARKITEKVLFITSDGTLSDGMQCPLTPVPLSIREGDQAPGQSAPAPSVTNAANAQ
jgi:hypothetical protein